MSTIKSNNENMTINADGASSEVKFQANGVEKASISSAGAFTSTTIDATKLTGNLPAIDGSSLTGVGKVLQVVSSVYTTQVSTSSSTYVDSGATATITPTLATSKILVIYAIGLYQIGDHNQGAATQLVRGATSIHDGVQNFYLYNSGLSNAEYTATWAGSYLDEPATTSATTYKLQGKNQGGTTIRMQYGGVPTTITLLEMGA